MDAKSSMEVAHNSKKLAEKYILERNYGRAFSHYLIALKLQPEWRELLKEEFLTVLCKWGTILHDKKQTKALFKCYEQAIGIFPKNQVLFNNLGTHLLRYGFSKEAAHYFRESLSVEPHFIRARHNLENCHNVMVERWHFRMLNDNYRNQTFREAILKKIQKGFDRVLDIGTGTGILSLFCAEGKAKEIYACDSSSVMTELAGKVFERNNVSNIKIINKHSLELTVPEDIPKRVSLVVTETLDSGLFGEGILSTVSHAWDNLLLPPCKGKTKEKDLGYVIPQGARVYLVGIECDYISQKWYLRKGDSIIRSPCRHYDTEDLKSLEFRYLTEVKNVFIVDFNDPSSVRDILEGRQDKEIQLKVKCPGRLVAFAVWFDLLLDEDIILSTSPESKTNESWDQAVFPVKKCVRVDRATEVTVKVGYSDGKLSVQDTRKDENLFRPNKEPAEISKDDYKISKLICEGISACLEPTEELIKTFNNVNLVEELHLVADELSKECRRQVKMLDCFTFPVTGLSFLKKRGKGYEDSVTCLVPSEEDKVFVDHIAENNGVRSRMRVMLESDLERLIETEKFDVILLNFVEESGEIKDRVTAQLKCVRLMLNDGGKIIPEEVSVIGQFIYSNWLARTSRVLNDKVTCDYKIGDFLNAYQVRHHIDINTSTIEKTICSSPIELFSVHETPDTVTSKTVSCPSSPVTVNALLYWFKIRFRKESSSIETKAYPWHQSAFLFPDTTFVDEISFNIVRHDGLFSIELVT